MGPVLFREKTKLAKDIFLDVFFACAFIFLALLCSPQDKGCGQRLSVLCNIAQGIFFLVAKMLFQATLFKVAKR